MATALLNTAKKGETENPDEMGQTGDMFDRLDSSGDMSEMQNTLRNSIKKTGDV